MKLGQIFPRYKQSIIRIGPALNPFDQYHVVFATPLVYGSAVGIEDQSTYARSTLEICLWTDGSGGGWIGHGTAQRLGGGGEEEEG